MKRYVIRTDIAQAWNASSKARKDAEAIAYAKGYELICFTGNQSGEGGLKGKLQLLQQSLRNWRHLYRTIDAHAVILVQYPIYPQKSMLWATVMLPWIRLRKKAHFVALVHDVNSARNMFGWIGWFGDHCFLRRFDRILCHNSAMQKWLEERGIASSKLCTLQLFDYLTEAKASTHCIDDGVAIAGNLEVQKSGYINALEQVLANKVMLHLYGKGYTAGKDTQALWHGAFPPDELPEKLQGAFGLIWDGPSVEQCEGAMGKYLKFNSPHKASLYLASGMPLLVWNKAAIAPLVEEWQVGLTITSLAEIPEVLSHVTPQQYEQMCEKAEHIGERLRRGDLLYKALNGVESSMGDEEGKL